MPSTVASRRPPGLSQQREDGAQSTSSVSETLTQVATRTRNARMRLSSRDLTASVTASILAAMGILYVTMVPSLADGHADCTNPNKPEALSTGVNYWGTASCASPNTTGLAEARAKLKLRQADDIPFYPDPWYTIAETTYTAWFPYSGSRYKESYIYCYEAPYEGDFRGRFHYEFGWVDNHVTTGDLDGATVDSQC